jgi:Asp-tRNA(Asn)/Glu-tRNA(Gln) amidotransferase A subunit family amidase
MIKPRPYVALAPEFRSGKTTPRAYLESCLDIIARLDPKVGAFLVLNTDTTRRVADEATTRWREDKPISPIDGMPLGIKDIIETIDMPTGQGSPLWKGFKTGRDSAAVHALREAGAIILGKTSTTEFAASEPWPGTCNPHDHARSPGGSSSGSAAAVGTGMIPAALGTQVVGSILRPASYCGCVGFKPTVGALNRGGSYDHLSQAPKACSPQRWRMLGRWRAQSARVPAATPATSVSPARSISRAEQSRRALLSWKPAAGA